MTRGLLIKKGKFLEERKRRFGPSGHTFGGKGWRGGQEETVIRPLQGEPDLVTLCEKG